jgi:hypothetical protein
LAFYHDFSRFINGGVFVYSLIEILALISMTNKLFSEAYESVLAWFRRRRIKRFHRTTSPALAGRVREENDLFVINFILRF